MNIQMFSIELSKCIDEYGRIERVLNMGYQRGVALERELHDAGEDVEKRKVICKKVDDWKLACDEFEEKLFEVEKRMNAWKELIQIGSEL
jgi:hypothetical protein